MTIKDLQTVITTYRRAAEQITRLNDEFGIDLWAKDESFLPDYEQVIYDLTKQLFGEAVDHFWDYILETGDISFDELCEVLEIEDYVPQPQITQEEVFEYLDKNDAAWDNVETILEICSDAFGLGNVNPQHIVDWIEKEIV